MKHLAKWILILSLLPLAACTAEEPLSEPPPRVLVHPGFDLSLDELQVLVAEESPAIQSAILKRPQVFLDLVAQALDLPEEALILVDKQHSLSPDYKPEMVLDLDDYSRLHNRPEKTLGGYALPSLLAMSEAAEQEGIILEISSTYRSYKYQEYTYQWCVDHYGQEEADRVSAFPGKSQHQLGNAVDFGSISEEFEFTEAGQWLLKNAWKYGWSLSYPEGMEEVTGYKYEVWHYRYITTTGTQIQREFFENIQQYFLVFWNEKKAAFAAVRIEG